MVPHTSGAFRGWLCRACGSLKQDQRSIADTPLTSFDDDTSDARVIRYGIVILIAIMAITFVGVTIYKIVCKC